jgi:hypothetical protein
MAELAIAMTLTKADVVSALRTKLLLLDEGIEVDGILVDDDSGTIPLEFLEDLTQLQVIGAVNSEKMKNKYQDGLLTHRDYMDHLSKIEKEVNETLKNN